MGRALRGVPAGGRGPPGISAGWARPSRRHFSAFSETCPLVGLAGRLSPRVARACRRGLGRYTVFTPQERQVWPRVSSSLLSRSVAWAAPGTRPGSQGDAAGWEGSGGGGQWGWALSFGRYRAAATGGPARSWGLGRRGRNSAPP